MKHLRLLIAAAVIMAALVLPGSAMGQTITPYATGIDMQNLSPNSALYSLQFYDASGALAYTYTTATPMSPWGGANVYIPNIPGTSLGAGQYSAVISSDQVLGVVSSLNSYSGSNPQYGGGDIYLATSSPQKDLTFPLVYRNHTSRHWWTQLVVQDASGASQSVTLNLFNSGSTTVAKTKTVTIPGNASFTFNLEDAEYAAFGPFGTATVSGSAPLAGVALNILKGRMTDPNTNYLDTISSMYRAFTSSQVGHDVVAPLVYKNYNLWTTGINVVNTEASPTVVTVTYTNANPAISGGPWTDTLNLGPNSGATFYTPATPAGVGLPDGFFGSATIHSDTTNIAVVMASQRYRSTGAEGVAYEGSLPGSATHCASLPVTHNRSTWKTGINILNLDPANAGTFTLNYHSSNPAVGDAGPQTVNIPAGQPLTVYMPTSGVTAPEFYGAVDIKADVNFLVNVANSRADASSHGVASNYVGINYTCP